MILKASSSVVKELLLAYPNGARVPDDLGMLPCHLAFRYQASETVINLLLDLYPDCMTVKDKKGRVPFSFLMKPPSSSSSLTGSKSEHDTAANNKKLTLRAYVTQYLAGCRNQIAAEQQRVHGDKLKNVHALHQEEILDLKAYHEKVLKSGIHAGAGGGSEAALKVQYEKVLADSLKHQHVMYSQKIDDLQADHEQILRKSQTNALASHQETVERLHADHVQELTDCRNKAVEEVQADYEKKLQARDEAAQQTINDRKVEYDLLCAKNKESYETEYVKMEALKSQHSKLIAVEAKLRHERKEDVKVLKKDIQAKHAYCKKAKAKIDHQFQEIVTLRKVKGEHEAYVYKMIQQVKVLSDVFWS